MAIQFPGGTTVYTQIAADTKADIVNNLKSTLVTAGWTSSNLYSQVKLTFTGLPANAQPCAFDGQTYTFKTTLAAAFDVKIGATAGECASNLFDAITDNTPNEGTTYGTGTTAHPNVTATVDGAVVTVTNKTAGPVNFTASEGLNNATLDSTASYGGGFKLLSAKTPQGLTGVVRIYDPTQTGEATRVHVRVEASDDATKFGDFALDSLAGRMFEVCANKYQFFVWILSSAAIEAAELQVCVPHIRDGQKAPVVSAVADSGGLYKITTSVAHGLTTGDHVFISNAEGQTGINGSWQVTVIDTTNYTLDGSTYAAGYTANSAVSAAYVRGQIARLIVALGYVITANATTPSLRNSLIPTVNNSGRFLLILNQFYNTGAGSAIPLQILGIFGLSGASALRIDNWGIIPDLIEPRLAIAAVPGSSTYYSAGQLWGAILVMKGVDMDVTKSGWNSHNWINYCNNYANGSLWLATN